MNLHVVTRIFAISGFSGTGKTTLVESVIQGLVKRGYRVASAKSSKHDPEEVEGTDTWRHRKAGASLTIFMGPRGLQVNEPPGRSLHNVLHGLDYDFLIVEGMKTSKIPKIWCIGDQLPATDDLPPKVVAVFAWDEVNVTEVAGLPVFYSRNIEDLLDIIQENAEEIASVVE